MAGPHGGSRYTAHAGDQQARSYPCYGWAYPGISTVSAIAPVDIAHLAAA